MLHPTLFSTVRGNVLVLNNRIQCKEQDKFTYQEMFAFLPLFGHPNPKQVRSTIFSFPFNLIFLIYLEVLIINEGEGCFSSCIYQSSGKVDEVVLWKIDQVVINVLPNIKCL
ncbi:unnamed protein product [Rotaria sp. Silwood2]|nr:unnamed protein product [Rotaria sp. Silwood2]